MGKTSRQKGYRGEREARKLLKEMGFEVVWQAEDPQAPDIRVDDEDWEVKYRKSVPKTIYKWLEEKEADALLCRRVEGRGKKTYPWLVIKRLDDLER